MSCKLPDRGGRGPEHDILRRPGRGSTSRHRTGTDGLTAGDPAGRLFG